APSRPRGAAPPGARRTVPARPDAPRPPGLPAAPAAGLRRSSV
ncbi:MAG: hypothetical protein AVDCRST_MAG19-3945, partial [uncultured Thermomicrobiales bacterium]